MSFGFPNCWFIHHNSAAQQECHGPMPGKQETKPESIISYALLSKRLDLDNVIKWQHHSSLMAS